MRYWNLCSRSVCCFSVLFRFEHHLLSITISKICHLIKTRNLQRYRKSPFHSQIRPSEQLIGFHLSPPDPGDVDADEIMFDNEEKMISPDLDTSYLPSPPCVIPDTTPLVDPSLEKILSDIRGEEQSKPKRSKTKKGKKIPNSETQDPKNGKRKMVEDCDHECPKAVGFSYPGVVLHFPGCESDKKKRKSLVKRETMDEVASIELMKEVKRKLWLTHYDMLSDKLMEVIREKCTGYQMNDTNQLAHEFCLLTSVQEQVKNI